MPNKTRLNILYLPGDYYPAFRSVITEFFGIQLAGRGHKIHHVMLTKSCSSKKIKINGNNIFHLIPINEEDIRGKTFDIKGVILHIIEKENIDIIHVRDDKILAKYVANFSKTFGIPFAFQMTTLFHSLEKDLIKERKTFGNVVRYFRGLYTQHIYKKIIKQSDLFLPITEAMADHYRAEFPDKHMLPLPLQAPHEFIHYDGKGKPPSNKRRIIYIGQISYIRKMEFMIDVLSKLPGDVEMMFVGPPQQDFVIKEMKEHADKLGILDRILFIGRVDKMEIPDYITSAHVGVSPIPPLEAFRMSSPTKVVEYLSLGVPVVANREIEDQKNVIKESGGGFAVEYDVDAFADKLLTLLNHPDKAKSMGLKGKKWIKKNRNYKVLAEALEKAYIKTVSEYRSR